MNMREEARNYRYRGGGGGGRGGGGLTHPNRAEIESVNLQAAEEQRSHERVLDKYDRQAQKLLLKHEAMVGQTPTNKH